MKGLFVALLALALVDSSSAQASYYSLYKMYSSQDKFCTESYQSVYNSDLNEARIETRDNSITSAQCYKNAMGQYIFRTCDSTSNIITTSTFSSSGCSGIPDSVSTMSPSGFCIFFNDPPLIYMGCASDEKSAQSRGYQDVNKYFNVILVRYVFLGLLCGFSECFLLVLLGAYLISFGL
jgi:hypothetical protein